MASNPMHQFSVYKIGPEIGVYPEVTSIEVMIVGRANPSIAVASCVPKI